MEWLNESKLKGNEAEGCGAHVCWSRDDADDCSWDYCTVRVCATKFCIWDY